MTPRTPRSIGSALVLVLSVPSTLLGQGCAHSAADTAAVRAVAVGIIAADNARDLARVLGYYAPDAELYPPGEPVVRGRPAIRPRYEALFSAYDPAIESDLAAIALCGSLAVLSGRNTGVLRSRGGGQTRELSDVFVMVLERRASGWSIVRLIWHSDRT